MAAPDTEGKTATAAAPASMTMRFDLVELETFLVVVELGSFSLAARRLHISQPSVTSRVQRLESLLKTKLLVRTTRHVEPTNEGKRLQERAEITLRGLRDLLQEFQADAQAARLRVTIASTPMISAMMLPTMIHDFGVRYPDIEIHLRDLQYEDVIQKVESADVDFAVVAFDNDSKKLHFEPLSEEDILLIVPQGHPLAHAGKVSLSQLAEVPLVMLSRYSMLRDKLASELRQRNLAMQPTREVINLSTLLGLVDAGLGATVLPRSMAQRYAVDTRCTLEIEDIHLTRSFGILRNRNVEPTPAVDSFIKFLQDNFESIVVNAP